MIDPVQITQSLVSCASVTPEDDGAQQVLKDALVSLGFTITDLPFEGNGGSYPVQNFFARLGDTHPHLCFAGHTDVVPVGDIDAWSKPPFSADISNGKMIGRGTSDMKGNICAFVAAVSAFIEEHSFPKKGSISFLITGDEEAEAINGTRRVLEWMKDTDNIPDVCLVGEPTNPETLGQEVKIGRRGSLKCTLTVSGKQGHVAYPDQADNPLPRLVKMLDALNSHIYDQGSAYFPPTNLEITSIDVGNEAVNVIPASGNARFNLRFSDRWTAETLDQKLRDVLDSVGGDYDLQSSSNAESFLTKPGEWTNLVAGAVMDVTGQKPALTTNGGTSDARFIQAYCPVVEFGLINKTVHQVDEHLMIDDLNQLTHIYKEILIRYFD